MCFSCSPRTITFCRRPNGRVISISSPDLISRCGFAACPLTSTLPPSHARFASERVLSRHVTSSQTSRRIVPELYPSRSIAAGVHGLTGDQEDRRYLLDLL